MPTQVRTGHVIDEYSVAENTIICTCAWKGNADNEWAEHKAEMRRIGHVITKKKQTPFQESIRMGIQRKRKVKLP